jgi:nucleotide-binding universal stress UspA family protein
MTTTLQSDVSRQKVLEDWSGRRSFSMFPFDLKQLVVLTDLTKESKHAVDYAVSLAEHFQAGLTLLHVCAPLTVRESYFDLPSIDVERDLLRLERAIGLKHTPCRACLRQGRFGEEAFKVAEERSADLLVVSENNLSWFRSFIQEDYNGKFILDAPCPVAVISHRETTAP